MARVVSSDCFSFMYIKRAQFRQTSFAQPRPRPCLPEGKTPERLLNQKTYVQLRFNFVNLSIKWSRPFLFNGLTAMVLCMACMGCSPSIAPFSHIAYEMAVDLKVDSIRMMDEAELPYTAAEKKVNNLLIRVEKAFEFANGRPMNEHSTEQWRRMLDPERNLLAGFFERWKTESTLSRSFIVEAKTIISQSFDAIIGLESGKVGGSDNG